MVLCKDIIMALFLYCAFTWIATHRLQRVYYFDFWRLDGVRQADYYGFVLVLTRHMGSHASSSERSLFLFLEVG